MVNRLMFNLDAFVDNIGARCRNFIEHQSKISSNKILLVARKLRVLLILWKLYQTDFYYYPVFTKE